MSFCGEVKSHPLGCGCSACLARQFEAACQANVLAAGIAHPYLGQQQEAQAAMQRYPALKTSAPLTARETLRELAQIGKRMPPPEVTHPIQTAREAIADLVKRMLEELASGSVTRGDIVALQKASTRALADHDLSQAIGKLP